MGATLVSIARGFVWVLHVSLEIECVADGRDTLLIRMEVNGSCLGVDGNSVASLLDRN